MNVFIFHGSYGHPNENWFPWLKKELEKKGCRVIVPQFPTPENQTLDDWMDVLEAHKSDIQDSILVGHSVGAPFALKVAEKYSVKSIFLIGGFAGKLGLPDLDPMVSTFIHRFEWKIIKRNCKKFYVFHSENDPYIKKELAEDLALKLDTQLIIVKNAGHFNEKAGYNSFELLLEYMKKEI